MAKLLIYSGAAEKIGHTTSISGGSGRNGISSGAIRTKHVLSFRINQKPVQYNQGDLSAVSEGDSITCAGIIKKGVMEAYVIRNNTTGVTYGSTARTVLIWLIVIALAALGLTASVILAFIGIPLLLWVPYGFIGVRRIAKAHKMVAAEPAI